MEGTGAETGAGGGGCAGREAERTLQCGAEAGVGGGRTGLRSHPGLRRPDSGFGVKTPEEESGFGGSEMPSGCRRYLAKNFVLKPVESSGLGGSERKRRSSALKRREDWESGGQRRQAGRNGGGRREAGSPEQQQWRRERWGR